MNWHPRLRGASAKTRRGAKKLFDIVNLKRRRAISARILRARLRRRRGSALPCVRLEGRGRFVPPCFEMCARDCVRPPMRARALSAGADHFGETNPGCGNATASGRLVMTIVVDRWTAPFV